MKKAVKILAIVLIIGGISIFFIHLGFFRDFVKNKFCQYLEKEYALTAKIERLDYNLLKPSFRLIKLEFKYQDTPLFSADEIYVEPSYKIYFGSVNVFRKIIIRNPHVNIIKTDKGFLLPNTGKSQKEQHPANIRVRNLEIISGQIKLEDQKIPVALNMKGFNVVAQLNKKNYENNVEVTARELLFTFKNKSLPPLKLRASVNANLESLSFVNFELSNNEMITRMQGKMHFSPHLKIELSEQSRLSLIMLNDLFPENIHNGILVTSSTFLYDNGIWNAKSDFTLEHFSYRKIDDLFAKGNLDVQYPQFNFQDIFIKYRGGSAKLSGGWDTKNSRLTMDADWKNILISDFMNAFDIPVKSELRSEGKFNFSGDTNSPFAGSSFLKLGITSPASESINIAIDAHLLNKKLNVSKCDVELPGSHALLNNTAIMFESKNLEDALIKTDGSVHVYNFIQLKSFISKNFGQFNKYEQVAHTLNEIKDIKTELAFFYDGNAKKINKGQLSGSVDFRIAEYPEINFNTLIKVFDNSAYIWTGHFRSDAAQGDIKGEIVLNSSIWRMPLDLRLTGDIPALKIEQLAQFYPSINNQLNGEMKVHFSMNGSPENYTLNALLNSENLRIHGETFPRFFSHITVNQNNIHVLTFNLFKTYSKIQVSGDYNIASSKFQGLFESSGQLADFESLNKLAAYLKNSNQLNSQPEIDTRICKTTPLEDYNLHAELSGTPQDLNGKINLAIDKPQFEGRCMKSLSNMLFTGIIVHNLVSFDSNINKNEFKVSGQIRLKPPFETSLKAVITRSAFFNLPLLFAVPDYSISTEISAGLSFDGQLLKKDTYKIKADFDSLSANFDGIELRNETPFHVDLSNKLLSVSKAKILSGNSFIGLDGKLSFTEGGKSDLSVQGSIQHTILQKFFKKFQLDHETSFDLKILQSGEHPYIEGKISSRIDNLQMDKPELQVRDIVSDVTFLNNEVQLNLHGTLFESKINAYGTISQRNLMDLITGKQKIIPADLHFTWEQLFLGKIIPAKPAQFDASADGEVIFNKIGFGMDLLSGQIHLPEIIVKSEDFIIKNASPVKIIFEGGNFVIEKASFGDEDSNLEIEANINITKQIINALSLKGNISLSVLEPFLKNMSISGDMELDAQASGTFSSPKMGGKATLILDDFAWPQYNLFASNGIVSTSFNMNQIKFDSIKAEINGGELNGNGEINIEKLKEPQLNLEAVLKNVNILYPEGLNASANAELKLIGKNSYFKVTGTVEVKDALFKKDFYPEREALANYFSRQVISDRQSELPRKVSLEIAVSLPEYVHFTNNIGNIDATGDFRILGTLASPLFLGKLKVYEGGTITYAQKDFTVKKGELNFNGKAYYQPSLDISLQRDEKIDGRRNKDLADKYGANANVQINIEAKGEPENLQINMSSQPQLTENEIVTLLAGTTAADFGSNLVTIFTGKYTGYAAHAIEKTFGLQQFKFEPLLVSNEANPAARLTFGKSLTKDLFFAYSLSLSNSSDQTWIADYSVFRNFTVRALMRDDHTYNGSLRQSWNFGLKSPKEFMASTRKETAQKIDNISTKGDIVFPENEILALIKIKKNSVYSFAAARKSVEELQNIYQEKGYYFVKVSIEKQATDNISRINLVYRIAAGKQVNLTVDRQKPNKELIKEIKSIFGVPYSRQYALKEAQKAIIAYYLKEGFLEAKGEWHIKEDAISITMGYALDKGVLYQKTSVIFSGNKALGSEFLTEVLGSKKKTFFAELLQNFERYQDVILVEYAKRGYYKVTVQPPVSSYDRNNRIAEFVIKIDEGIVSRVQKININIHEINYLKIIKGFMQTKESKIFLLDDLIADMDQIVKYFHSNGFPNARAEYNYDFDQAMQILINIDVDAGNPAMIKNIIIAGNRITSTHLIAKQLAFKTGEKVNLEKFSLSYNNLYKLGVFNRVRIYSKQEFPDPLENNVYVEVDEIKPYAVTYGIRYDSENKLEVEGEFVQQNIFHQAHYSSERFLWNRKQKDLRFAYGIPAFIRRNWRVVTFLEWQKEYVVPPEGGYSFYNQTTSISAQHEIIINKKMTFLYNYGFKQIHTYPKVEGEGFDFKINVSRLTASLYGDFRDDRSNAHRGYFYSIEAELSPRILGSELNFIKIFGQFLSYTGIFKHVIWASSVRIGLADAFDDVLIPSERFYTGGGTSVRGYKFESLGPISPYTGLPRGGESMFVLNQELRFPVYKMIGGVFFYDAGNIYQFLKEFNPLKVRQSIGFGLRADTPVGLLRLDIGFKLKKGPEEKAYELFFSIGQLF